MSGICIYDTLKVIVGLSLLLIITSLKTHPADILFLISVNKINNELISELHPTHTMSIISYHKMLTYALLLS